ncbi:unnamed protein product [Calypogeia fissa]
MLAMFNALSCLSIRSRCSSPFKSRLSCFFLNVYDQVAPPAHEESFSGFSGTTLHHQVLIVAEQTSQRKRNSAGFRFATLVQITHGTHGNEFDGLPSPSIVGLRMGSLVPSRTLRAGLEVWEEILTFPLEDPFQYLETRAGGMYIRKLGRRRVRSFPPWLSYRVANCPSYFRQEVVVQSMMMTTVMTIKDNSGTTALVTNISSATENNSLAQTRPQFQTS